MVMDKSFWLSWVAVEEHGPFTLHTPWWISGARLIAKEDEDIEEPTICAAVRAQSEEAAKEIIFAAHDTRPAEIEFRFCEPRPDDWAPFSGRFQKGEWMKW